MQETITAYSAAWGETDEAVRRAFLEDCWAEDGVYQDPMSEAEGREALVQLIGRVLTQMPGARIELTSAVSTHHDKIYFAWKLVAGDGSTAVEGVDFGVLSEDGKLASITGFFGPPGS